jgi:hypothetical protein
MIGQYSLYNGRLMNHDDYGNWGINAGWFVININNKTEKAFTQENEYLKYLKEQGIEEINLYEVNEVYKLFDAENRLPLEWGNQPKK